MFKKILIALVVVLLLAGGFVGFRYVKNGVGNGSKTLQRKTITTPTFYLPSGTKYNSSGFVIKNGLLSAGNNVYFIQSYTSYTPDRQAQTILEKDADAISFSMLGKNQVQVSVAKGFPIKGTSIMVNKKALNGSETFATANVIISYNLGKKSDILTMPMVYVNNGALVTKPFNSAN